MRSDLDHLPLRQQADLRRALDVLFAAFEEAQGYFEYWFPSADNFRSSAKFMVEKKL